MLKQSMMLIFLIFCLIYIDSIFGNRQIQLQIQELPQLLKNKISHMRPLKFKEIRKSIINHNQQINKNVELNKSPLKRNLFGQRPLQSTDMSFKSIKQSTMSPFKQAQTNSQISTNKKGKFYFQDSADRHNLSPLSNKKRISQIQKSKGMYIYDSDRKTMNYQKIVSNFESDQKENQSSNSIYLNRENKENSKIDQSGLSFTHKDRKINTTRLNFNDTSRNQNSNYLYETAKNTNPGSLNKKNSSGMLFKNALQTSNKKKTLRNNLDSDRSTARQSSLGKLKQRLFGMKKIISEKQNRPSNEINMPTEQTKSFTIYTKKQSIEQNTLPINSKNCIKATANDNVSFSKLVLDSVQKDLTKGTYQQFCKVQQKKDSTFNKVLMNMNQSSTYSVNVSVAQSCDSILDMSPNL